MVLLSSFLKYSLISSYPFRINIEPTNIYNLHCPICPTGSGRLSRKKGAISFDLFKKIIDETGDYLFSIILFGYGEPFMCPDIIKMIRYAVDKKIWVWTSTNGHFFQDDKFVEDLVNSGLHHLLVCFDGLTQESIEKFRKGANFQLLVDGTKKVIACKKRLGRKFPYLELQFIKMKHNKEEISQLEKFAREIGFDRFSVKNIGISLGYNDFEALAEKYLPQ